MKWDIDKAVAAFEDSEMSGTSFTRVEMSGVEFMEQHLGKLTAAEREKGSALVWCMGLGRILRPKRFFYARSLHQLHLKVRRAIRTLSPEELDDYGLKAPKRRKKPQP
jgi:hypothetical protein